MSLLFVSLYGQNTSHRYENRLEQIRKENLEKRYEILNHYFVFEGTIIKRDYYYRNKTDLFESDIVQISRVFRGFKQIKTGTVEIVFRANPYLTIFNAKRETDKSINEPTCVFFCREALEYPYNTEYNIDPVNNKIILTDLIRINLSSFWSDRILQSDFGSKTEIYEYLKTLPKIDIVAINEQESIAKQDSAKRAKPLPVPPPARDTWVSPEMDSVVSADIIRNSKKVAHDADSVYQIKWREQLREDSIENAKKKFQ